MSSIYVLFEPTEQLVTGKTIHGMSSFGVKNVVYTDIVTHDIHFNNSEDTVDYLSENNPQFS